MSDPTDPTAPVPPAPEAEAAPAPPPPAPRPKPLDDAGLDLLFREARTHYRWSGRDVTDETLAVAQAIVDLDPLTTSGSSVVTVYEWNTR